MNQPLLKIALLAGGESQRMGRDKAQLPFGAVTLLEHMARTAMEATPRVVVVGRTRPGGWPLPEVDFIPDEVPGLGPLGALRTVLALEEVVLMLACDMPLLTVTAIHWLIEQGAANRTHHGLIVSNNGQWEPLFSIYTRACLPLIEANLVSGRRSLHALIKAGDFGFVEAPSHIAGQLVNVNTPEDWTALKIPVDC